MRRRTLRFAPVACLLLAALSGRAGADDRAGAAAEMEKANGHLTRHEYEEAIARFNVARKLVPASSGPYLGLGLAYAATDRCREAVAYLEEYLTRQKTPKPEAQRAIDSCRPKMVQPGRLKISSDPSGAEVRVDDETGPPLGVTPFEKSDLSKGNHRVYLTLPGYRPHTHDVVVEPGVVSMISAALEAGAALPLPPSPDVDNQPKPDERKPDEAKKDPERVATLDPAKPPEITGENPKPPPKPEEARPAVPLIPRIVDGELDLSSTDKLSSVYVNNQQVAADGHARLRLPPGLYGVRMERDGYRGADGAVTLVAGDKKAFRGTVKPQASHGMLSLGVGFTLLAAAAEAAALTGHFLGNQRFVGSSDFTVLSNLERYGQVGAGVFAAVALTGYIVDAVQNRGHVSEGPPYRLEAVTWPESAP